MTHRSTPRLLWIGFLLLAGSAPAQQGLVVKVNAADGKLDLPLASRTIKGELTARARALLEGAFPFWSFGSAKPAGDIDVFVFLDDANLAQSTLTLTLKVRANGRTVPPLGVWPQTPVFKDADTPRLSKVPRDDREWIECFEATLSYLLGIKGREIRAALAQVPVCRDVDFPKSRPPSGADWFAVLGLRFPDQAPTLSDTHFRIDANDDVSAVQGAKYIILSTAHGEPGEFTKGVPRPLKAVRVRLWKFNDTHAIDELPSDPAALVPKAVYYYGWGAVAN